MLGQRLASCALTRNPSAVLRAKGVRAFMGIKEVEVWWTKDLEGRSRMQEQREAARGIS